MKKKNRIQTVGVRCGSGRNPGKPQMIQRAVVALTISAFLSQYVYASGGLSGWGAGTINQSMDPNWGQSSGTLLPLLIDVAAGEYHTVARDAVGNVVAWGKNTSGQCNVPPQLGAVQQVAAGASHCVALKLDGTVAAWGANNFGQCNVPAPLVNVGMVEAGNAQTIALRLDGTVACWGNNLQGQLNVPTGLVDVVQVDSGANNMIARRAAGTAVAWGDNTFGQCSVPAGLGEVVWVSSGGSHSVAVQANGSVRCWGNNGSGQCSPPVGLPAIAKVSAGGYHTVALTKTGGVVAWGGSGSVNFGQGSSPGITERAVSIAAGGLNSVAVVSYVDTDGDGRPDSTDNCPTIANPLQADCNTNGVGDACEIAAGAPDFNHDTIPDTCQCLADLFIDGQVNGADLGALLAFWGPVNPALPSADINRDGFVNGADLGYLLNAWGPCTN